MFHVNYPSERIYTVIGRSETVVMQGGVLAEVEDDFEDPESFHKTHQQDGTQFTRSFQIKQTEYLESGEPVYKGEAAMEVVEEAETVKISENTGDISVTTSPERSGKYTQFLVIPGELMVVGSGSGEFAFNLLPESVPGVAANRTRLDLNEFAEDYYTASDVDPWQVGFFDNPGEAEKGVVYGQDVFDDSEIGDLLERSEVNQLGLEYEYDGKKHKITTSRSGYVEVYQPSNLSFEEYAQYLVDEVSKYADRSLIG